ncbi:hypothetical protein FSP39_012130 [Pinctada imbricata]|uniref:Uncharacterized protein n=1 Tax=Pinctada imbricata TaxID=66713 RepID=A0AA88XFF5_PINIB|nr:hypothetical protein FSP39_012130 [Pinctada imbricata]
MTTDRDDWCVYASDEELYDPTHCGKGTWMPHPEDILKMFEKLSKQKVLELKWKCPGRRPPEIEISQEEVVQKDVPMETEEVPLPEEPKPVQPTEFDFDDAFDAALPVTPKRTPGSKTPKSQKKVAKMDKILQDVMLQQRKDSAEREAKRRLQRSPRTPQTGQKTRPGAPGSSPLSVGLSPGGSTPNKSSEEKVTVPVLSISESTHGSAATTGLSISKEETTLSSSDERKLEGQKSETATTSEEKT